MNKLLKYAMFFLATGGLATGCTDLEEELVGDITEEITFTDPSGGPGGGSVSALTAAYAELRNAGTANHGGYYSLQELPTDEMVIGAKGGDWFDGGILIELHRHTYTSTHAFVNNTWNATYNAINTVNEVLARTGEDALTPEETAQARALRAYFYWRLLDLYGNVKIVTTPGVDAPQTDRATLFNFIEDELLAALGISEVSTGMDLSGSALADGGSAYVLNRYGALGILANLYLNAEVYTGTPMYDKAEIAADYIISSGVYQLCGDGCAVANLGKRKGVPSDPDMLEGYAAVFAPNNEGNPEHIFSVLYDEATGTGMNFSQMNLHYASQFTYNLQSQPWNGYATLEEFYNSYEDGDVRKQNNFLVGKQFDFNGDPVLDYAADDDDIILEYTPEINELAPNYLRQAGARPAKFSYKQFGRDNMNNDFPIVRLGQMYLIRAEAKARQAGDWTAAEPDVNVIRARAKVPEYNGNLTEEEFLAELGREMFQETTRRTDLIRFGKYNDPWWEKPASEPFRNIFPIPFEQIQAGSGLTQNPGY
ncbi:MAG: RagB/SusD family nutrient uptake outer membrane protein [Bacteroidetes bacterium]|nr:MAG: RagB/SusD family nutrient uptake outer membrane protein [Bacteroidota bacterium]